MNMVLALGTRTILLNSNKPELKPVRPQAQNIRKYQKLSKRHTLNTLIIEKKHLWLNANVQIKYI